MHNFYPLLQFLYLLILAIGAIATRKATVHRAIAEKLANMMYSWNRLLEVQDQ